MVGPGVLEYAAEKRSWKFELNFVFEGLYYDKILVTSGTEIISHFMHACMPTYIQKYIHFLLLSDISAVN